MAKAGGSPWWLEPSDPRADSEIDASLLRAMDEDPRLGNGAGPARADNVLDFIQMTGLTTGRPAATAAPVRNERADDPVSFFEFGVRDVDGSGDPVEPGQPELDLTAFHVASATAPVEESQSLLELRQIIAELAEETEAANTAVARLAAPEASVPAREPEIIATWSPAQPVMAAPITAVAEPIQSAIAIEAPAPKPAAEVPSSAAAPLAAAADLLRELTQANETAAEKQRAHLSSSFELKHPVTAAKENLPEPEADKEDYSSHMHFGLQRRRRHSFARRWLTRLFIVAVAAAIGYFAWESVKFQAQPPRAAFTSAQALLDSGDHRGASAEFLSLARRYHDHPVAADALFMAGYALQLEPEKPAATAKQAYTEAVGIFEKFIAEYPAHEKVARAETLMGLLYQKTGRDLEAINLLGDPERRLRDPGAYLMALRTLGRAYADVGQIDNARSAFMRAAALESNMTPDADYVELANLYQSLAARSGEPAQRRHYLQLAVEQWEFAMQVPGMLKSRKDDVKLQRDAAVTKLDAAGGAASDIQPTPVRTVTLNDRTAPAGETPVSEQATGSGSAPN